MTPEQRIERALEYIGGDSHAPWWGHLHAILTDDGKPKLGDPAVLHVEGYVSALHDTYFVVETEGDSWTVEYGDTDWKVNT